MDYGYIRLTRAWYAKSALKGRDFIDEIWIGAQGGDESYELAIRFYTLGTDIGGRLEIFDDGFEALCLPPVKKFLASLCKAGGGFIDPDTYETLLDQAGFEDVTPEEEE